MQGKKSNDLPIEPLRDLLAWWRQHQVKGAIIGGLAVGLHGRPRATRDVDAVILLEESLWPAFLKSGKAHHFFPRIDRALEFARRSRVLLVHHQPSAIDVDLSLGNLPFEQEAVARAVKVKIGRLSVPLATIEDLIILKSIPRRERDIIDMDGLLEAYPNVDQTRIRRWVDEFAQLLEVPEIYTETDRLLSKKRVNSGLKKER